MPTPRLPPFRLRKHADYQLVYKHGRKQNAKNIAYFYALRAADRWSDTPGPRIGLTVPKALGKAVDRNRIKRRMREAVRRNLVPVTVASGTVACSQGQLSAPLDVVLHPRRVVMQMEFAVLEREVGTIFRAVQAAFERGIHPAKPQPPKPRVTKPPSTKQGPSVQPAA